MFLHRLNSKLAFLYDSFGVVPYQAQIIKLNANWLGHVARSPPSSALYRVFFWRCQAWRDVQEVNVLRTRARFFSVGRPAAQADALPSGVFGPAWPLLAGCRQKWCSAVRDLLVPYLPPSLRSEALLCRLGVRVPLVARLAPLQFTFLDYISNRHADMLYSATMLGQCRVMFYGDSQTVVNCVLGRSEVPVELSMAVRHARWCLYGLTSRWRCIPIIESESELLYLAPRGANWFAEWACTFLQASGGNHFVHWRHEAVLAETSIASRGIRGLVVSFKGLYVPALASAASYVSACVQNLNDLGECKVVMFCAMRVRAGSQHLADCEALLLGQRLFIQAAIRLQLVQSLESLSDVDLNNHLGLAVLSSSKR